MKILLILFITPMILLSADKRFTPLFVIEKELLYLTNSIKAKKATNRTKEELKQLIILEQYIALNGLSSYSLELISGYRQKKLYPSILDCLVLRAIDFDLRHSPNFEVWKRIRFQTKKTYIEPQKITKMLSDKISQCLVYITPDLKWTGPAYKYYNVEKRAKKITRNGLNIIKNLEKK